MIKQLTIIGLGLIGGSVARALKAKKLCKNIIAYDNQTEALNTALKSGIIDGFENTIKAAVKNADLILIAVPLSKFSATLKEVASYSKLDAIITDVGSVKKSVIDNAKSILDKTFSRFVAAHPIAGSEKAGIAAANADLFNNRLVILTPTLDTDARAIETIKTLWEKMGAKVQILDADLHDQFLATTSHLPQLLAYAFMDYVASKNNFSEVLTYSGPGFRDFTRLAASNPSLWQAICIDNRNNILKEIQQFKNHLTALQHALETEYEKKLLEIFNRAKTARDVLL